LAKCNNYASQIPSLKSKLKSETAIKNKAQFDYKNLKKSIENLKKNQRNEVNKLKLENRTIVENLQQVFKAESDQLNNIIKKKDKIIQRKSEVIGNLTY